EVVVQLQVSLTPDVERFVLLEGEVLPCVLHCQFHQPTHPLTGCGDDRPSSRFSTTSMQVRSERAPSSVTASSAVFLGSPAPSSVTSYQTKESPSSGSGFVQLKLTTPPALLPFRSSTGGTMPAIGSCGRGVSAVVGSGSGTSASVMAPEKMIPSTTATTPRALTTQPHHGIPERFRACASPGRD